MPKIFALALVGLLSFAGAVPSDAGSGRGRGFRSGHSGVHHRGLNFRGCCWGGSYFGGYVMNPMFAAPFYAFPYSPYAYSYPYLASPEPAYAPAPAYQPAQPTQSQTELSVAPSAQGRLCYAGGCYWLAGDGLATPYQWVWVPAAPPPPPPLPPDRPSR